MKSFSFLAKFETGKIPAFGDGGIPNLLIAQVGPARGHFCVEKAGKMTPANDEDYEMRRDSLVPVFLDAKTLEQMAESGNSRPEIKAKLKHGDIDDLIGGYSGFRIEGDKLRADLKFMTKIPAENRDYVIEMAQRFSTEVGNSVDFDPVFESGFSSEGKKIALARCKKLSSVDVVDTPAATSGLFSEIETPPENSMPFTPEQAEEIKGIVKEAVGDMTQAHADSMKGIDEKLAKMNAEPSDEEKKKKSDEEDATAEKMATKASDKLKLSIGKEIKDQLHALTGGKPLNLGAATQTDPNETATVKFQAKVDELTGKGVKIGAAMKAAMDNNRELYDASCVEKGIFKAVAKK